MHRITWSTAQDTGTFVTLDGLCKLPQQITNAFAPYGLALSERHAMLLTREGPVPMSPGVPVAHDGARLAWQPLHKEAASIPSRARPWTITTQEGESIAVGNEPFLIGRHPSCDLRLEGSAVSFFHCALCRDGEALSVLDLANNSGTFINGARVQKASVSSRGTLRVGQTRLLLEASDPSSDLTALRSPAMRKVLSQVRRVAATSVPVLVLGESGVGKELVARELHRQSGRAGKLVTLNTATLSSTLAANELFGHTRGSFTGAERDHAGAFLEAHEGTLFLDEVTELSPTVQASLLRVVELGRVRQIGTTHERPVDTRLVLATHRDLTQQVLAGAFREDLFHRLCVVTITVPPLCERPQDIDVIADRFLATQAPAMKLTRPARQKLKAYSWPGNVRELLNTLRRAAAFTRADRIYKTDIIFQAPLCNRTSIEDLLRPQVLKVYDELRSTVITSRRLGLRRPMVQKIIKEHERARRAELGE